MSSCTDVLAGGLKSEHQYIGTLILGLGYLRVPLKG